MIKQLLLIISGFVLGQGSMFAAQTYLVFLHEMEVISIIGIGVGLLSLLQWASDGGGVFLLSKQYAEPDFLEKFSSFLIARIIIGGSFCFLFVLGAITIELNAQIISMLGVGWVVVVLWSLNITGILDRVKKNQIAGPMSGLSWLFSAIAVACFYKNMNLGVIVALAYSFGLLVTVVIQWWVAVKAGLILNFERPSFKKVIEQLKLIALYNAAFIAAQGYARLIPILVDRLVSAEISGIFIYAKNVANMVSQVILFSRRVEFSGLVDFTQSKKFSLIGVLLRQKYSLVLSIMAAFFSLLFVVFIHYFDFNVYYNVAIASSCMVCLVVGWVIVSSYGQVLLAVERTKEYALVVVIGVAVGLLVLGFFLEDYGLLAVYGAEILMYLIQGGLYLFIVKRLLKGGVIAASAHNV